MMCFPALITRRTTSTACCGVQRTLRAPGTVHRHRACYVAARTPAPRNSSATGTRVTARCLLQRAAEEPGEHLAAGCSGQQQEAMDEGQEQQQAKGEEPDQVSTEGGGTKQPQGEDSEEKTSMLDEKEQKQEVETEEAETDEPKPVLPGASRTSRSSRSPTAGGPRLVHIRARPRGLRGAAGAAAAAAATTRKRAVRDADTWISGVSLQQLAVPHKGKLSDAVVSILKGRALMAARAQGGGSPLPFDWPRLLGEVGVGDPLLAVIKEGLAKYSHQRDRQGRVLKKPVREFVLGHPEAGPMVKGQEAVMGGSPDITYAKIEVVREAVALGVL